MSISEISDTITLSVEDTAAQMRLRMAESQSNLQREARRRAMVLLTELVMPTIRRAADERGDSVDVRIVPAKCGLVTSREINATLGEIADALRRGGYDVRMTSHRACEEYVVHVSWAPSPKVDTGP